MARISASDSAAAPRSSSFSRGRSSIGQSRMPMSASMGGGLPRCARLISFARAEIGAGPCSSQPWPELPKPPAPRAVLANSSTTSNSTCTTGTMTICAMRSPGLTVKEAAPRFQHDTINGPW